MERRRHSLCASIRESPPRSYESHMVLDCPSPCTKKLAQACSTLPTVNTQNLNLRTKSWKASMHQTSAWSCRGAEPDSAGHDILPLAPHDESFVVICCSCVESLSSAMVWPLCVLLSAGWDVVLRTARARVTLARPRCT